MQPQPQKLKRAVIKEEFVVLTGDMLSALILDCFICWSNKAKEIDVYIEKIGKGIEEIDYIKTDGWVSKTITELREDIMGITSEETIKRRLNSLIKNGWIKVRFNPYYKWNKVKQYKPDYTKIHNSLCKIGYFLQEEYLNEK